MKKPKFSLYFSTASAICLFLFIFVLFHGSITLYILWISFNQLPWNIPIHGVYVVLFGMRGFMIQTVPHIDIWLVIFTHLGLMIVVQPATLFICSLNQTKMVQSMSRVGRCIDNGPMEGFWGILKSEMYYLRKFTDEQELTAAIENYILFYNTKRYQKRLRCMTPMEFHAAA